MGQLDRQQAGFSSEYLWTGQWDQWKLLLGARRGCWRGSLVLLAMGCRCLFYRGRASQEHGGQVFLSSQSMQHCLEWKVADSRA